MNSILAKSLLVFALLATQCLQAAEAQQSADGLQPLSEPFMKWVFGLAIICITIAWTSVPIIFAWQGKLDAMLDVLRRGTVLRFVTVTYIVLVVVTLSLVGRMHSDHVATLLGSIAGFVLGQATQRVESRRDGKQQPDPDA